MGEPGGLARKAADAGRGSGSGTLDMNGTPASTLVENIVVIGHAWVDVAVDVLLCRLNPGAARAAAATVLCSDGSHELQGGL